MDALVEALERATRPLVTLALTGALIWGFIAGLIGGEAFLGIVGGVIGFWFSQRQAAREAQLPKVAPPAEPAGPLPRDGAHGQG